MRLYKVLFTHYSQKDSQEGIYTYLVAKDSEDVYEWIKAETPLKDGSVFYSSHRYYEEDNVDYPVYNNEYEIVGYETHKERMVRLGGEMFDEDWEVYDLYYGATTMGWVEVSDNISMAEVVLSMNLGISIEITDTYLSSYGTYVNN